MNLATQRNNIVHRILDISDSKLLNKIEEYQNSNKQWELKVNEISNLLSKIEEKNKIVEEINNSEFLIKFYRLLILILVLYI